VNLLIWDALLFRVRVPIICRRGSYFQLLRPLAEANHDGRRSTIGVLLLVLIVLLCRRFIIINNLRSYVNLKVDFETKNIIMVVEDDKNETHMDTVSEQPLPAGRVSPRRSRDVVTFGPTPNADLDVGHELFSRPAAINHDIMMGPILRRKKVVSMPLGAGGKCSLVLSGNLGRRSNEILFFSLTDSLLSNAKAIFSVVMRPVPLPSNNILWKTRPGATV
jgi:hypothetical protein